MGMTACKIFEGGYRLAGHRTGVPDPRAAGRRYRGEKRSKMSKLSPWHLFSMPKGGRREGGWAADGRAASPGIQAKLRCNVHSKEQDEQGDNTEQRVSLGRKGKNPL